MENIQMNWFFGTIQELSETFQREDSPVRRAGLKLISAQEVFFPCQFAEIWRKTRQGTL